MEVILKKELSANEILNTYLKCDDSDIGGMKILIGISCPWEEVEKVESEIEGIKTVPQKNGTVEFLDIVKVAVVQMLEELWLQAKFLSD